MVPVRQLSSEDRRQWTDLAVRAVEPNPFHEPSCVIPAALHQVFGNDIRLVLVEDGDRRLFACLPLRHVRTHWHQLSYSAATTKVRRYNYLGTPLIDPARGLEATITLLETLVEECRAMESLFAEFVDVTAGGPADRYLRQAVSALGLGLRTVHTFERGVLQRKGPDDRPSLHSAETVRNLQKKLRRLGREVGEPVAFVDRADDQAIADYIQLEGSGYKGDIGAAMVTVPGEPEYFADMCRRFASAGRLHLLSLMAGSTTAATMAWLRAGDSMFMFKCSYNPDLAKYSPGQQIHAAGIERFYNETDADLLDTCTGWDNDLVLSMYRARRTLNRYQIVFPNRRRDRALVHIVGDGEGVRSAVTRRLHRLRNTKTPTIRGHRKPGS